MSGDFDAIIVGSGPNGFAAGVYLQQKGLKTAIIEQSSTLGGGVKTLELSLPGFKHDIASAIHPLAFDSPFFKTLPLADHGLEWVHPAIPYAHPFSDGDAFACYPDIDQTAQQLGKDADRYQRLFRKLVSQWKGVANTVLGPISFPRHPLKMADFGIRALMSARFFANSHFREEKTRMFFYGAAAHSTLPLNKLATASFGLVLNIIGHTTGWPFPKGGAGRIIDALGQYYQKLGGKVFTNHLVKDLEELPRSRTYLLDLTPRQILKIRGLHFSSSYIRKLSSYKYGAGVFKIDWALSDPIPFTNDKCRQAGTVHLGYSADEIEASESMIHHHKIPKAPYVLVSQHTVFDPSRAPAGKHTGWAYCHVPNGSSIDMTQAIENQIEIAAPGFKDCIIRRVTHNAPQLEFLNPNLVGGDINGGMQHLGQMFTRPVAWLSPYSTPDPRIYICSSSTPPGGGVHGMCGYHAARRAWKDHFRKEHQ